MNKKSSFSQIILLIILSAVCILLTVGIAFLAGFSNATMFDFKNLNLANMIPVFLIGGFISCVIIGIAVLFVSKSIFSKMKEYITEKIKTEENEK